MAAPRVLFIAQRMAPQRGGLAVATERIAQHVVDAGGVAHVVVPSQELDPGVRGQRTRGGVTVHPFGYSSDEETLLSAWTGHGAQLIAQHGLNLVHGIYATQAGYVATLLARLRGLPSVVSIRGNDVDRGLFRARELPLLSQALTQATVVTGVSRAISDKAARFAGRSVTHVTNAVDTARFAPTGADNSLRASLALQGEVVGFLGELREKKGIAPLLSAFAQLCQRREASLLLIGGVRSEAEPLLSAFREAQPEVAARIKIVPYTRDPGRLCRLMALCDLMVFPSLADGTPNATLEAMAAGRPILASDAGGLPDLIRHGEDGGLLPVSDLGLLGEAMEEFLSLPKDDREAMGRKARRRAERVFSPEVERGAYQRIYAEILRPGEASSGPLSRRRLCSLQETFRAGWRGGAAGCVVDLFDGGRAGTRGPLVYAVNGCPAPRPPAVLAIALALTVSGEAAALGVFSSR